MNVYKLILYRFLPVVLLTGLAVHSVYAQNLTVNFSTTPSGCTSADGTATITANGTPPYTFKLAGSVQTTGYFTGLSAGIYTLDVIDATASYRASITIPSVYQPVVTTVAVINPSPCNQNGSVTLDASGGVPPYQYSLTMDANYQTSNVFTGLTSGIYTFYVMDANGCIGSKQYVNLYENRCPLYIYGVGYSGVVYCIQQGSISFNAGGGTPPYQFSIDGINYGSSSSWTNLPAGIHIVYVKDAAGLIITHAFQMWDACRPELTYVATDAACNQQNGVLAITATNGEAPYTYSIDGINFQAGNVFNGLAPGNYTITLKDAKNRIATKGAVVNNNCPQLALTASGETCRRNDGTITATAVKGTAPFEYSTDGINFQTNPVFSALPAGDYTITLKDALGSTTSAPVKVTDACVTVSAVAANSTCGNSNGSIIVSSSNGTAPYEYSTDGVNYQSGNSFSALAAGTYTVWVRDAAGTINSIAVTVNNTAGPQVNATPTPALCTNKEGTISIAATGGATPYQYSISGNSYQASGAFNNLASGNYTVWVKDANGCIVSQPVVVAFTDNLSFIPDSYPVICEGAATVFNNTSNGSSFSWSPTATLSNASVLNPAASPIVETKYYVTASLGICTKRDSVTVFVNPAPVADAGSSATICFGERAQLHGAGGVSYLWSPVTFLNDAASASPQVVRPTSTTSYSLVVTDANGCRSVQPSTVTVTVAPQATVFAGNDTAIAMNQPFVLQAQDMNNSGFTQYGWSPSYGLSNATAHNPVAVLNENITYTVTATTPQGCSGTDAINIKVYRGPEIYVANAFSPNGDGRNDVLKAIPVGLETFKYFHIYNRWGQLIFSTSDALKGWNGEVNHKQQGADSFVWMAEGQDAKGNVVRRKGVVMLIR